MVMVNCKYYDTENGWCKKKSCWKDPMPEVVYCLGNCRDQVVTMDAIPKKAKSLKIGTQLFRATTAEDLKHTANIWYQAVKPKIIQLTYKSLETFVELYLKYEEEI